MSNLKELKEEYIKSIIKECDSAGWKKMQFNSIFYSILNRSILLRSNKDKGFELFDGESKDVENQMGYKKAIVEGYIPLVELVNLFRYLEKSNLISFIPNYQIEWIDIELENFKVICPGIDEEKEHDAIKEIEDVKPRFPIKDTSIVNFLDEKYSCLVSISPALRTLVERGFKTIEQIQFEQEFEQANVHHEKAMVSAQKQICYSRWAFIVAITALLVTLFFNIWEKVIENNSIESRTIQIIYSKRIPDNIKMKLSNGKENVKVNKVHKSNKSK